VKLRPTSRIGLGLTVLVRWLGRGVRRSLPDVATTIGATYTVSFWLGDNSNDQPNVPEIDMLGCAEAGRPVGTIPVNSNAEPETYALMLAGLARLSVAGRRRRR
jgi:hypothetical protein